MKLRTIAAALIALAAAPAQAQTYGLTCAHIEAVAAAIQGDLRDIRGGVIGADTFEAKVDLPSYFRCTITDMGGPFLACARYTIESLGAKDYKAQLDLLASCFPNARTLPAQDADTKLFQKIEGIRYLQRTPKGILTVGLIFSRDLSGPRVRYQLGIGFRLLPPDAVI
jgi:hypothetical protein